MLAADQQACFQHGERCQIAEFEAAINRFLRPRRRRIADRHPFEIGLHRYRLAARPVAFGFRLVVLRTVQPAIIGDFVIVPHTNESRTRVGGLHVRVGFRLCMAQAIVCQRHDFMRRIGKPIQASANIGAVTGIAIFVDIVAKMNDRVQPLGTSHVGKGVEIAAGVQLAGSDRKDELVHRTHGQGAEATGG